ncbi:MAG: T9SS type A sorting domain-containing protein [Candidatus Eisenbacteria bacterium]|uniref:T9SS type A sorting domain-containing protein n=1 Tax=Eiseniibacteriota bacterium TaxID=2212470 RepID=A0A948RUJ7_UNCEI|nr:T9SS type A sorting domain-containing protein [Candidatus Eisenbacteria bacterium]MBU1948858.1 T9SS type A sorting domain-containing protein [Candidatus Eisenbacteria bacterium]MBU2691280.1 T9SS type A sorting domain-containing protein [Candidatus Eisenbacteria bacterium]
MRTLRFNCWLSSFLFVSLTLFLARVTTPQAQYINISNSEEYSEEPDLAVGSDLSLHIVWSEVTGGIGKIIYRQWKDGEWSSPFQVSDGLHNATVPSISVLDTEHIWIAWQENHANISRVVTVVTDGVIWDRYPIAPEIEGNQLNPFAYFRADGSRWVSWTDSDSSVYVANEIENWVPFTHESCFGIGGNLLCESPLGLTLFSSRLDADWLCHYVATIWNGSSWIDPGGEPSEASAPLAGVSRGGSSLVHLAALPGALPPCPCWHLLYTPWEAPTGWGPAEVLSKTFSEWWTCQDASIAVDNDDQPIVSYVYQELDELFETTRRDLVIARRSELGWYWEYSDLAIEDDVRSPDVEYFVGVPAVTWSQMVGGNREIMLSAAISGLEDSPITLKRDFRIWPNPSHGIVNFAIDNVQQAPIQLEVVNILGQRVRSLAFGRGQRVISWDGIDTRGASLGSGIYYARIQPAEGPVVTKEFIRLR